MNIWLSLCTLLVKTYRPWTFQVLRGTKDTYHSLLDVSNFELNFKAVNKLYEEYVLSVGDFDERIFLGESFIVSVIRCGAGEDSVVALLLLVLRANCMLPSHLTSTWNTVEPLVFAIAGDNTAALEAITIYLFLSRNFANRCMQQPEAQVATAADYTALESIAVYFILGTKIVDQRMPRPVDPDRDCGSWRLKLLPFTASTNLNDVWFSTNIDVVKEDFLLLWFYLIFLCFDTSVSHEGSMWGVLLLWRYNSRRA